MFLLFIRLHLFLFRNLLEVSWNKDQFFLSSVVISQFPLTSQKAPGLSVEDTFRRYHDYQQLRLNLFGANFRVGLDSSKHIWSTWLYLKHLRLDRWIHMDNLDVLCTSICVDPLKFLYGHPFYYYFSYYLEIIFDLFLMFITNKFAQTQEIQSWYLLFSCSLINWPFSEIFRAK